MSVRSTIRWLLQQALVSLARLVFYSLFVVACYVAGWAPEEIIARWIPSTLPHWLLNPVTRLAAVIIIVLAGVAFLIADVRRSQRERPRKVDKFDREKIPYLVSLLKFFPESVPDRSSPEYAEYPKTTLYVLKQYNKLFGSHKDYSSDIVTLQENVADFIDDWRRHLDAWESIRREVQRQQHYDIYEMTEPTYRSRFHDALSALDNDLKHLKACNWVPKQTFDYFVTRRYRELAEARKVFDDWYEKTSAKLSALHKTLNQ